MSVLIQVNIRKEDETYINYIGSVSDYFDLDGNNIEFLKCRLKNRERVEKMGSSNLVPKNCDSCCSKKNSYQFS
jgi:hypothetical protein